MKIKKNTFWALIPARGNSKSIKKKNLFKINNKPLLGYAIDAITNAKIIEKSFCSSEDREIIQYCKKHKFRTIERPNILSSDNTKTIEVLKHFIGYIEEKYNYLPEYIFLFEPTSPFVQKKHIYALKKIIQQNLNVDFVQTITKVPHNLHAFNQRILNGRYINFYFLNERNKFFNKQSKPIFYSHGNLRLFRTKFLKSCNDITEGIVIGSEIENIYAFDFDTIEDLRLANIIAKSL